MTLDNNPINQHLQQAMDHLEKAINLSIEQVLQQGKNKKEIGRIWEQFITLFIGLVRRKSVEHRVNLLGWIAFPRWRR
ncbi:MAG TPA: hypothetical protein VN370_03795 [Desulfitobacteriaceae bacterium]|nr:hypothetical protein [Desulfitobacteriaceae bacterium]